MFLVALHIQLCVWFSLSTQDVFAIDVGQTVCCVFLHLCCVEAVQIVPLQKNNTTTTAGNCIYIYI
jgi:hypothetical protein